LNANSAITGLSKLQQVTYTYLGCYQDSDLNRILHTPLLTGVNTQVSIASCARAAALMKYAYFGLERGSECWAGNDFILALHHVQESAVCDMLCASASRPSEVCGGVHSLSLYSVGQGTSLGLQDSTRRSVLAAARGLQQGSASRPPRRPPPRRRPRPPPSPPNEPGWPEAPPAPDGPNEPQWPLEPTSPDSPRPPKPPSPPRPRRPPPRPRPPRPSPPPPDMPPDSPNTPLPPRPPPRAPWPPGKEPDSPFAPEPAMPQYPDFPLWWSQMGRRRDE